MDVRTRKMLKLNGGFHRQGSALSLYMKRKERRRGLISAEECVRLEEKGLFEYVNGSAIKEVAGERSWQLVEGGYMAVGTECYIFAAQEQALGTRWARNTRFKEEVDSICRVCGKQLETVSHLASGCGELAKKQ